MHTNTTDQNLKAPNQIGFTADDYVRIDHNYSLDIEKAYILSIPNNEKSSVQTEKCRVSLERVGMDYQIFPGFDGTGLDSIQTPDHLKNKDFIKWIRIMDHQLSITEVCCALGHLALWAHCMTINQPIVILEHDAIMLSPYTKMLGCNMLEYLGHKGEVKFLCKEYGVDSLEELLPLAAQGAHPPQLRRAMLNTVNYNWRYPLGLHAYAIDPMMARRLFSHVITEGLINPIDAMVRADKFTVLQGGIYACQNEDSELLTTIEHRDTVSGYGRKTTYTLPGVTR
jgi:GR25 family glycosyltransferase involved in LPS biosynthesis